MIPAGNLHSIAYQFNPDCLRVAREFRGLKKNELASKIHLTPSSITQFERGQVRPNAQTIAQLSMALGFPPAFFSRSNGLSIVSPDECHFRSLRSCSQTERRKMVGAGSIIGKLVEFVDGHIHLPDEQVTASASYGAETAEEIEEAAAKVRRDWGLSSGPIDNVVHLLEAKGVLVFRLLEDCKSLDAFSLWHQHRPFVFLNTEKGSTSRSRFDAAHELGHLVIHSDYLPGDRQQEDAANKFASAFLLPRETFLQECPQRLVWDHFRELKRRWKVSLAALVRRAKDLRLISEDTYKRAHVQLGKRNWRTSEPDEPEVEWPTILPQAMALISQTGWTISAIAQELNISERDLMRLTFADGEIGG